MWSEWLLKHVCIQTAYSWVALRPGLIRFQTFAKSGFKRGIWKKEEEEGWDDLNRPLPLFRAENYHGERKSAEAKEPCGSTEVERKRSRRWRGRRWGWCEDENWFIAALMSSGMPGDSGCSPSPCCGNIKPNRGPPPHYNCCRDRSKGLRCLCRNVCNPDCSYPACYFQSTYLDAASRDTGQAFCSAALTYSVNINPTHTHTNPQIKGVL